MFHFLTLHLQVNILWENKRRKFGDIHAGPYSAELSDFINSHARYSRAPQTLGHGTGPWPVGTGLRMKQIRSTWIPRRLSGSSGWGIKNTGTMSRRWAQGLIKGTT